MRTPMIRAAWLAASVLFNLAAQAAGIVSVSPQGEVARVRQVVVKFDTAVVPFGDLRQPDPMAVACQGPAPAGGGRWINDRAWAYDFKEDLGPGVRCSVKPRTGWKPQVAAAGALAGRTEFTFQTGGPAVSRIQPGSYQPVEEDQHFLLVLNGPAVPETVQAKTWCEVEGIGERIGVKLIQGKELEALLEAQGLRKQADRVLLLACARALPSGAKLRLVWGAGIASAANPQVLTSTPQRYDFQVRPAFSVGYTCERSNAEEGCLPILPVTVTFSAPVPRALAEKVRLKPAKGSALEPVFGKDDHEEEVTSIRFPTPLAENTLHTVELPSGFKDSSGRAPGNAASFPMKVEVGDMPPLAKFAAAPFGIIERLADATLPVTLRHVQPELAPGTPAGGVRVKRLSTPEDIRQWYFKLKRFHESSISAEDAGLPRSQWQRTEVVEDDRGRKTKRTVENILGTREVSLLKQDPGAKRLDLPEMQSKDPRPFEVVGIPLPEPGYHVVEIESTRLGASLLEKKSPMYVRTGVLVTNLGVHFKLGRESSAAWVTTLDRGQAVAGAEVRVHDCNGQLVWKGSSDAQGVARIDRNLQAERPKCSGGGALFVTATKTDAKGVADIAFVFSDWHQGIEPWRFNVSTGGGPEPDVRVHSVLDRTLLRAGETVGMKHFMRLETGRGLALPAAQELPARVRIVHEGSGQEFTQDLAWNGSRSAVSSFNIPAAAKLGSYQVYLQSPPRGENGSRRSWPSGEFRVEEYRLPLVDARVVAPKGPTIAPKELPLQVQLKHFSGGPLAQAAVRGTAVMRPRAISMAGYDEYSFEPPAAPQQRGRGGDAEATDERGAQVLSDKEALTTDKDGNAAWALKDLPALKRPMMLEAEATYNDPNGEVQTVATQVKLWPAAVVVGIKTRSWTSSGGQAQFSVLALDTQGQLLKGQAVSVRGHHTQVITTRKRMVGGFYAYDNRTEEKDLGTVCSGKTDERGLLLCDVKLDVAGEVQLVAQAKDGEGRLSEAAGSVSVTRQGELWFEQDNDDRIEVLPEKKRYEPGETARLQVRMPFREATALVAVEREGIIETRVVTLRGDDPTVELKIQPEWGPNVYVSVLTVRGRIRHVPWYSFFTWGWKEPVNWWRSWRGEGQDWQPPTAMVDLSKPAFKLGLAHLKVGIARHELQVKVLPEQPQYTIRQAAKVRVQVLQGGKPAAGAEVAFAAVDEGLLALRDNDSWDLLHALVQERPWSVATSTAQSEIIGRRHYGRKALAAGGGGGRGGTRELFDTLLLWKPQVTLDAKGEAVLEVPLNDSLTSFRLVAVADAGEHFFGTGTANIAVTQDLQMLSGLPPLVRGGDQYQAMMTLRNTTAREMKVKASLAGTVNSGPPPAAAASGAAAGPQIQREPLALPPQELVLPAGATKELAWTVNVPAEAFSITWEGDVAEQGSPPAGKAAARDRIKVTQFVKEPVPVRVLQATLMQLEAGTTLPVAAPADGLSVGGVKQGGLGVAVQPRLTGALPGMRRYFETYPFICLEQKTSKAVGLRDAQLWQVVYNALPTYLDSEGLANYFPPRAEDGPHGSDRLTAYVLAATHEAGFDLPPAARDAMLDGLANWVQGRIQRKFWAPRNDLDVRKLAAIEALSRYGRAQPAMLGSINIAPNTWPTAAVIDWLNILRRLEGLPERAKRMDEAQQILRARLTYAGTTLKFSNEETDFWWWLMDSADVNAARLVLAVLDEPAWKDELPRLVVGALGRQKQGHWLTTTANLWGSLALDKFAAKFESQRISGRTVASVASLAGAGAASGAAGPAVSRSLDWAANPEGGRLQLPWPAGNGQLTVTQEGGGRPWLTVQSLAAIPLKAPLSAGYAITRTVTAQEQKVPGQFSRGDVLRVKLEIEAQSDMTWVVVSDPVPGGATILGSGLGRDSALATRSERKEGSAWSAYEERSFEAFRSYYEFMPKGRHVLEYTVRLNNPGRFAMPPSRVEAMYAPESFGEAPIAPVEVKP